ncbi:interferon alpha/beta receptor 1-like isoform X2 [Mixophyes fleayi]|uniref:interferon alpha/beta receptor 1-like isoform X2 n=1 Tax=Mixophyes fleayi TaxID=3061075 RepID=UPI003F4DD56B
MSWVWGLMLQLLPVLLLAAMASSELEPPSNIQIRNYNGILSVSWNWDNGDSDGSPNVTFTAFYQKSGALASEIPGCIHTDSYICNIPPELLDISQQYILQVRSEAPQGESLSNAIVFSPNLVDTEPPPLLWVDSTDGIVIVNMSTQYTLSDDAAVIYIIFLQENDSNVESFESNYQQYIIPYKSISPGVTYCVRVQLFHFSKRLHSPSSPANCFKLQLEGSPKNLRVEAVDTRYLLQWDWDYEQYPNVTFSVEQCNLPDRVWKNIDVCGNITVSECDISGIYFYQSCILRTSVYESQRGEYNSSLVRFSPYEDAIMGPPTNIDITIVNNDLFVLVSAPEGFKDSNLLSVCDWEYYLEFWNNSTHTEVKYMNKSGPHFHIEALEISTTYCMKVRTKCDSRFQDRTGLYSEIRCITTDPRSYVTAWITGSVFFGIIVISIFVYICLCPLKRYMKTIFFPSSKLPSSIGKDMQDSSRNFIKIPFSLHEDETFDRCYIIQDTQPEDMEQIDKNASKAKNQDSGNYSNDDQATGETDICTL